MERLYRSTSPCGTEKIEKRRNLPKSDQEEKTFCLFPGFRRPVSRHKRGGAKLSIGNIEPNKAKGFLHPIQDRLAQVASDKTKVDQKPSSSGTVCRLSARCNVVKLYATRDNTRAESVTGWDFVELCCLCTFIQRNAKAQKISAPIAKGSGTNATFSDERTARSVA